eukprot:13859_1
MAALPTTNSHRSSSTLPSIDIRELYGDMMMELHDKPEEPNPHPKDPSPILCTSASSEPLLLLWQCTQRQTDIDTGTQQIIYEIHTRYLEKVNVLMNNEKPKETNKIEHTMVIEQLNREFMMKIANQSANGNHTGANQLMCGDKQSSFSPRFYKSRQRNNGGCKNNNNSNPSRKRKRKRKRKEADNDKIVMDDVVDELDGDWVPPTKKPKTNNHNQSDVIDLLDSDGDGARKPSKNKKKLKFKLKRQTNPGTHRTSNEAVKREIAAKKKGMDPVLNGGDMFPFAGASLSRIRPMMSSYPIVIPSYARWFRLDRIHPIEYESLHSLFVDKAMQYHERYLDIRNFVVNSYRLNPRIYLTVTAARRIIAADAGCVYRIHEFLEHWGLINYQMDDGSMPEFEPAMMDYTHIDTPFGVKIALKEMEKGEENTQYDRQKGAEEEQKALNLRENMFCVKTKTAAVVCTFCDIECSQARYRCTVQTDMILCAKCFDGKRYSMVFNENDFEMELTQTAHHNRKIKAKTNYTIEIWSEDELKKLKYGIKTWHDDWTRVSEYVGRNEEECIAQFIQLPIRDPFVNNVERKHVLSKANANTKQSHALSFLNTNTNNKMSPFADAGHPVLAQCASLSAIVDTELVKIASAAALQFVSKQKVIEASALKVNDCVDTKMGRGVIQHIMNKDEYQITFEWGCANVRFDDIIDIAKANACIYPQNVNESKAKAAGILATTTLIAKALKKHKDGNIEQLLQHLVLLQTHKVKAKIAHLDQLWHALQQEKEEVEDMKQELFRERIELAKQRLDLLQQDDDDDDEGADIDSTTKK